MTKEEILAKRIVEFPDTEEMTNDKIKLNVGKAMDEFAKQQSIAFTKWLVDGTYDKVTGDYDGIVSFAENPENLYELFLTEQSKTQNSI